MYRDILGARSSPTMPDIPQPSSTAVDKLDTTPVVKKILSDKLSHSAKAGVIFHRTMITCELPSVPEGGEKHYVLPAPVVPPARLDDSTVGD
jgi:hypothetical protein